MDWIAAQAQVTKPTVYAHFGTKAELFEELILHELRTHYAQPMPPVPSPADVSSVLFELSVEHIDLLLAEPRIGLLRAAAPETINHPEWAQSLFEGLETPTLAGWFAAVDAASILVIDDPEQAARLHSATLKGTLFYPALLGLMPVADAAERRRVALHATTTFIAAHSPTTSLSDS